LPLEEEDEESVDVAAAVLVVVGDVEAASYVGVGVESRQFSSPTHSQVMRPPE
jgi:hypothetical protein